MKRAIAGVLVITLSFLLKYCDTTEPPPPPPDGDNIENTITLTTLWQDLNKIAVNFTRAQLDTTGTFTYKLKRKNPAGGETQFLFMLLGTDTTFIDENLNRGTRYSYKVEAEEQEGKTKDTSKTLYVTTLDTTSHDIIWQIDTLGQPGNFLNDVWGLDENNVYAVGGINLPEGGTTIMKWNGVKWNYHSFPDGSPNAIWGFNESDIWLAGEWANRGFLAHFDGSIWTEYKSGYFYTRGDTVYPLYSVWGSSPDDVWAVGGQGTIIHWDGSEWNKVEGIDEIYKLWDIWGFADDCVYVAGNEWYNESILYKFDGESWNLLYTFTSIDISKSTVWGPHKDLIYMLDSRSIKIVSGVPGGFSLPTNHAIHRIRGSGANNIFTSGEFGEVFHNNGNDWRLLENIFVNPDNYILISNWTNGKEVMIVGWTTDFLAIVVRGTIN